MEVYGTHSAKGRSVLLDMLGITSVNSEEKVKSKNFLSTQEFFIRHSSCFFSNSVTLVLLNNIFRFVLKKYCFYIFLQKTSIFPLIRRFNISVVLFQSL